MSGCWWVCGVLVMSALAAPAASLTEAGLLALFPRPPATVADRLEADLDGDGRTETAVLYDTALPGRYRLGLITAVDGPPQLAARDIKIPLAEAVLDLSARDLTGDGTPELVVTGGYGPHGVAYQIYDRVGGALTTLLSLTDAAPTARIEADLDGDGRLEIVHVTGNHTVWNYVHKLSDWSLVPYRWDPAAGRYERDGLRAAPSRPDSLPRLEALVAGHLWAAAASLNQEAEDSPETRQNAWLIEATRARFAAQREQHRPGADAESRLTSAVAELLAGEYPAAAERLLAFARVRDLPAGWELPLQSLRPIVEAAFQAVPELNRDPDAQAIRGFLLLADHEEILARAAFERARELAPSRPELARWRLVGLPGLRVVWLGVDQRLRRAELTADGQLRRPTQRLREPGPLGAVAGVPNAPELVVVTADGTQALVLGDATQRLLLAGEFLHVRPQAVSPDGKWVGLERGISAIRELLILELRSGRIAARLRFADDWLWSPAGGSLAIELPSPIEPPLPWFDGATRDIALVGTDGQELRRLAKGSATLVWGLESWDAAERLVLIGTRYERQGLAALAVGGSRWRVDPERGELEADPGRSRVDTDRLLLARWLKLMETQFEPVDLAHPQLLLYRRRDGAQTELFITRRDLKRPPVRLGSAPPLSEPLAITFGGAPAEGDPP